MTAQDFSTWFMALATIVTAAGTIVLALVTWLLFKATRQMAAANEPYIVATLEPNHWSFIHVDLVVENTGSSPAFNIKIEFNPPLTRERQNQNQPMPPTLITVLRPSHILRNNLGNGSDILNNRYYVSISWKKRPNSKTTMHNNYELSIDHYKDLVQLGGGDPQVKISRDIQKIREKLDSITQGFGRLSVNVHTEENRKQETERQNSWLEQASEELEPSIASNAGPIAPKKTRRRAKP